MKKLTIAVLISLMLSLGAVLFFAPTPAHARPAADTACSGDCIALLTWQDIATHGAKSTVEVSAPTETGSDYFKKFMSLTAIYGSGGTNTISIAVGVETNAFNNASYPTSCRVNSTVFFVQFSDNGSGGSSFTHCYGLHTGDANNYATFGASYFVSNGGGFFFFIMGTGSGIDPCPSSGACQVRDGNSSQTFNTSAIRQDYQVSEFSGHGIWGTQWINNQFYLSSWAYDGTSGLISITNVQGENFPTTCGGISAESPPQMCWHSTPNGASNNGGTLYTCDYDSFTNDCTVGS